MAFWICQVNFAHGGSHEAYLEPSLEVFSFAHSAAQCQQCPSGRFNDALGALAVDAFGRRGCQACPTGTASAEVGATSIAACKECKPGWFAPEGTHTCLQCPSGTAPGSARQRVRGYALHAVCRLEYADSSMQRVAWCLKRENCGATVRKLSTRRI